MSLSEIRPGRIAIVQSITGGKHLRQKLVNLGLLPGCEVQVVRANRMGPMVLNVQGSQIMIGQGMARRINVSER